MVFGLLFQGNTVSVCICQTISTTNINKDTKLYYYKSGHNHLRHLMKETGT